MSICTRCGARFGCAVADGVAGPCWCMALPPLAALPPAPDAGAPRGSAATAAGCWCPDCLAQQIARPAAAAPTPALPEGAA